MSYIAFELDALNVARDVGDAAGIPEERVTHGLLRMWAYCFREKRDTVQAIQVQGFFGASAAPALVAFGFLEAVGADFRVRGAERYLRISEARRRGAEKTNAAKRERTVQRTVERRSSDAQATLKSVPERTLNDALTPSTEHRAPNTNKDSAPAPRTPRETDLLQEDFKAIVGTAYVWNGAKDGTAFAKLRKEVSLEEIRTRWKRGLRVTSGWLAVRTVAQLASKWNDLAAAPPNDLSGDWRSRVDHSKDFFAGVDS